VREPPKLARRAARRGEEGGGKIIGRRERGCKLKPESCTSKKWKTGSGKARELRDENLEKIGRSERRRNCLYVALVEEDSSRLRFQKWWQVYRIEIG
jgi:hypothetical protein